MSHLPFLLLLLLLLVSTALPANGATTSPSAKNPPALPADAVSLLTFKSRADLDNRLLYTLHERFDYCSWQGVKCVQFRIIRFSAQSYGLRGTFPPDTLTRLDQLRVLILRNNSLSGPIPDLSPLINLKSLILDQNNFYGSFPPSIVSLYKLRVLDLASNNFTGPIPSAITRLDHLKSLKLEFNLFNGSLPALNQPELKVFNVSGNNLTGVVPITPTLTRFRVSSFTLNPNLCGKVVNRPCVGSRSPFFDPSSPVTNNSLPGLETGHSPPLTQASSQSSLLSPQSSPNSHKRKALILGFSFGALSLLSSFIIFFLITKRRNRHGMPLDQFEMKPTISDKEIVTSNELSIASSADTITVRLDSGNNSNEMKLGGGAEKKSGSLRFSVGEPRLYTLEQLMRASAELLGRGIVGATYKAKLDNQLIVTVKRLDGVKTCGVSGEMFERHMEAVGALRHPNLVPVRAYFQAKGERLIIFDYQPNGSVFNLIHGSRSARAKPLHWTSCLKIAEDVAQGLAYIHQASKLVHGNIKATNVLLGSDFEACVTDYCLITFLNSPADENPDSACYKAPEIRKSNRKVTPKADVYAFGVLLLELLSGKPPSQHPFLAPPDMPEWVRATRDDDSSEDDRLDMLIEVASACSSTSPEQRPTMWQVLKMIQKIKSSVMSDNLLGPTSTHF